MLCNTSSLKWNWMRGQRLFIEEMKGVFTGPCSARSRWPCADFYTPCRAKLQPWATLIAWYTSFSFSLPSLMLSVWSRHQIVLMDVQNNVLTDKNPNTWACDPRDTFSLCVCNSFGSCAFAYLSPTDTSVPSFHLSPCDWMVENSAPGCPFSTWRLFFFF